MKKVFYPLACCCLAAGVFASCGGQKKANAQEEPSKVALSYSKSLKAPETDSLNLPVDENGYITIFDGETFNGWRGYGKDRVPTKWTIEDGCIKFNGSGGGEAQDGAPAQDGAETAPAVLGVKFVDDRGAQSHQIVLPLHLCEFRFMCRIGEEECGARRNQLSGVERTSRRYPCSFI